MQLLSTLFLKHREAIIADAPRIEGALLAIDRRVDLSAAQALALYVLALELQPDLIVELGRGYGNSTATFLIASDRLGCRIESFCLNNESWANSRERLGSFVTTDVLDRLNARTEDLTTSDFDHIVFGSDRVLVFWDAHGYDIADAVLSRLLPLIAERPHVVACHDISDARYISNRSNGISYNGLPSWRGMNEWYGNDGHGNKTAYMHLGWAYSLVDQLIPIIDFCNRNNLTLRSADNEIVPYRNTSEWRELCSLVQALDAVLYHGPVWFSLEGTGPWHFPATRAKADGKEKPHNAVAQQAKAPQQSAWQRCRAAISVLLYRKTRVHSA
jgi:hypothetical protein